MSLLSEKTLRMMEKEAWRCTQIGVTITISCFHPNFIGCHNNLPLSCMWHVVQCCFHLFWLYAFLCDDYLPLYWFLSCLHLRPVIGELSNCVHLFCVNSMISLFIYTILFLCFVVKSYHSLMSLGPFSKFPCYLFSGFNLAHCSYFYYVYFLLNTPCLVFDLRYGLQLWLLDQS